MKLQTQRLKIIACNDESLSTYSTEEFKVDSFSFFKLLNSKNF
jgi:hypothetical protein